MKLDRNPFFSIKGNNFLAVASGCLEGQSESLFIASFLNPELSPRASSVYFVHL